MFPTAEPRTRNKRQCTRWSQAATGTWLLHAADDDDGDDDDDDDDDGGKVSRWDGVKVSR